MSNNAPDYENDLVFPPQEIKSQHELSEQGRQSEVLIKAIEKCEKLEKQLALAMWSLRNYASEGYYSISILDEWSDITEEAKITLEQIKELDK